MKRLGLEQDVVDSAVYERTVERFRERGIALPTFAQLADPSAAPDVVRSRLAAIGPDEAHPLNLFRVHWHNDAARTGIVSVPEHVVLPPELTGTEARVVVALANRFPMIGAHKVLASYGCLAPRVVTGQFDPTRDRAIWPSTGNYCRGGVAISKLMGCRGVAVLPEGMSRERFDWLESWVADPSDIVRTPGTESNVKEIYDECNRMAADSANVIFNQFSEFGNYLVHYHATGRAIEEIFAAMVADGGEALRMRAFVSATGSAGTIAAGDYLKEHLGSAIVAVEALECPTMLNNGFGEHNIQGIGDKHIPLIHNVMNTDFVVAVSDRSTDRLNILFNTDVGRRLLAGRHHVPVTTLEALNSFGLSSICNVLAAIKLAKYEGLGPNDVVMTVATDGATMYESERQLALAKQFPNGFDEVAAGEIFGEHLAGIGVDNLLELGRAERERIFNLGYFTWVEQQGVPVEEFRSRHEAGFWEGIRPMVGVWDEMIEEFNGRTGVLAKL
ncbi:MAG: pyridoxal-phosphate dependent enzyme [Acidimicrobiales bacterium]|jgi:cysteine synthase